MSVIKFLLIFLDLQILYLSISWTLKLVSFAPPQLELVMATCIRIVKYFLNILHTSVSLITEHICLKCDHLLCPLK